MQKEIQKNIVCCCVGQATPDNKENSAWENETRLVTCQVKPDLRFTTADPRQKLSGMTPNLMSGLHPTYNDVGFTLIELLVVVLIIGILASVALPQYQKAVVKSRIMQVLPYLKAVKNAEESYYLANGEYTSDMDSLSVEGTAPSGWGFYLRYGDIDKVEAVYQNADLQLVTFLDHATDTWRGITYCLAKNNAKYIQVCKSMGAEIPNGDGNGAVRHYIYQ